MTVCVPGKRISSLRFFVYPILACIFFIARSSKYSKGLTTNWNKIGILVLLGSLVFVIGLLGLGLKEDKVSFNSEALEFKGSYGENLTQSEIQSIKLVDQLPKITLKTNGFALGNVKKGYFETNTGEIVKLILNADNKPYILITKSNGNKIYFSAKEESNEKLLKEVKKKFPKIGG